MELNHSTKIGFNFGLTSGIITTLGLMVGLHSGTHLKLVVIGMPSAHLKATWMHNSITLPKTRAEVKIQWTIQCSQIFIHCNSSFAYF